MGSTETLRHVHRLGEASDLRQRRHMAKVEMICETCGNGFWVARYRSVDGPRKARFCSGSCRGTWVGGQPHNMAPKPRMKGNRYRVGLRPTNAFEPGHTTWNRGMKGIHLSPASEFKPGRRSDRRAPVGEERVRRTHDGHLRMFVKVAEPNVWKLRAVKVWEDNVGPVPQGKLIHHQDRDTLNDDIGNLRCLTRAEHMEEHRAEFRAGT